MATAQEIIDYYADLLIIQYKNKPRAYATIQTLVKNIVMDQIPLDVQNAFDVDASEGVNLDAIGALVGVQRSVLTFTGPVTLSNDDFRTMVKVAIIKNNSGSSLYDIQSLLNIFFPGQILVFDFRSMRIGYFFNSSIGSEDLAEVFVRSNFLPKPMAVTMSSLIYSDSIDSFYGFETYELPPYNVSGFNSYDDYDMDSPWLSYGNAIFF